MSRTAINQYVKNRTATATPAQLGQVEIVRGEFGKILSQLQQLYENEFRGLEAAAERAGVPWTSGRMPTLPYVP